MPPTNQNFSQFLTEQRTHNPAIDDDLVGLMDDLQRAVIVIAALVSRGALHQSGDVATQVNVQGEEQKPFDVISNDIMLQHCEQGGRVCGMASEELEHPYTLSPEHKRGPYLLIFDPLDGSSNIDINVTVGSIFSVLKAPEGVTEAVEADFLQPGRRQVAAGFALYGPNTMMIITLGHGTHGFTFDRGLGQFVLTHPAMRIPETTQEFAINASNERFWEPPVRRYIRECIDGKTGPRGVDFNMRWVASMVAEIYRILVRGGIYMYPRDSKQPIKAGRLRLMYEANPAAMLVEQAGGGASTGREPLMDIVPTGIHQRVPIIIGSIKEVERLVRYHEGHDRGEEPVLRTPLFNIRTLFNGELPKRDQPSCR